MADNHTKHEMDGAAPPAKKRKLRKGVRKSKAERLAQRTREVASAEALDALAAQLRAPTSDPSAAWDTAQLQAQRLGSPAAKELVVRTVLWSKTAPRAAAHYARRLELPEPAVVRVLGSQACADAASSLLAAKFLSELSVEVVLNTQRLELFLWPWLVAQAKEKSVAASLSGAKDDAAGDAHEDEEVHGKAAAPHAVQAYGAAIRLLLLPPQAPQGATTAPKKKKKSTDDPKRSSEREELQRLLVSKCLATGEFLHLVTTFASAYGERVDRAKQRADDEYDTGARSCVCAPAAIEAEQARRHDVAERIEAALHLMWPDARVVVFGSSATGLLSVPRSDDADNGSQQSGDDLDLCVLLPSSPLFRQDTRSLVVELKEHLAVYLPECQELLAIEGARIPIVQFTDATSGVRCDMCINNLPALWNTQLVKLVLEDVRVCVAPVRSLSLWLKRWRRAKRKLFGKGLSSYGLQLLILYFFQQRRVLPTFHVADESVETEEALKTFSWEAVREALAAVQVEPQAKRATPSQAFWSVLVDFFRFYALEFDFEASVVCLRRVEVVSKTSKGWTRKAWKAALSIEDPIECDRDLGTLFTRKSLVKLRTAFVHGCAILSQENESWDEKERQLLAVMPYELERVSSMDVEADDDAKGDAEVQAAPGPHPSSSST